MNVQKQIPKAKSINAHTLVILHVHSLKTDANLISCRSVPVPLPIFVSVTLVKCFLFFMVHPILDVPLHIQMRFTNSGQNKIPNETIQESNAKA